ncbi:MAG: tripartite tricarboxylate transporter permease [Verrucomicrobiota bacterium]
MTIELLPWIVVGTVLGLLVGAVPGLTGAMVIALAIPMTFGMEPASAMALLVSMYVGSVSGGLITATLLKIPGTPSSIMTTLDAYPMAAKGAPRRALGLGIVASLVGGVFAWGVLVGLARPLARWSLALGPIDYFALVVMAFGLVVSITQGNRLAGLLSLALGLLLALPGVDPATGQTRLTMGAPALGDGLKQLPVLIGLFALPEAMRLIFSINKKVDRLERSGGRFPTLSQWRGQIGNLIRSSAIGSFVGVLPGIGANIGSLLAYGAARTTAKDRDRFGTGADSGVIASEAANNATVGGALVPLVALGIPGSVIDAILLGAFVIHGLQPGPLLFENSSEIVSAISWSYLIANGVMVAAMLLGLGWIYRITRIPSWVLAPLILVCCVVGSYAFANRMFDVWVMVGCGVLGMILNRWRVPLAPLVLGFVLLPLAESNLVKAIAIGDGRISAFSITIFSLTAILVIGPVVWGKLKRSE